MLGQRAENGLPQTSLLETYTTTADKHMNRSSGYASPPWDGTVRLLDDKQCIRFKTTVGISTRIYNHQSCILDLSLWPYAVRSISDWKNDYLDICHTCSVRDAYGGVFHDQR